MTKPRAVVEMRNVFSVARAPEPAIAALVERFTVRVGGSQFMKMRGRYPGWDGRVRFVFADGRFYTGLILRVLDALGEMGYAAAIRDCRLAPPRVDVGRPGVDLRDYQEPIVRLAERAARGIIHAATNSGKTEIAIALIGRLRARALFVVPGIDLLRQTEARFLDAGLRVGVITRGRVEPGPVTVGNVQTLLRFAKERRGKSFFASLGCVVADESHLMSGFDWSRVLKLCGNAYYRYALSATPMVDEQARNDLIVGLTGEVIARVESRYLVGRGFSAKPTVRVQAYGGGVSLGGFQPSFAADYEDGIVGNEARNAKAAEVAASAASEGKRVLVLVTRYQHAENILAALERALVAKEDVLYLSGKLPKEARVEGLARFVRKDVLILIATRIFNFGLDVKEIDAMVIAGAGKSANTTIQQVGRALRVRADKSEVDIYDFDDADLYAPSRPVEKRWLEFHYRRRVRTYRAEGVEVLGGESADRRKRTSEAARAGRSAILPPQRRCDWEGCETMIPPTWSLCREHWAARQRQGRSAWRYAR